MATAILASGLLSGNRTIYNQGNVNTIGVGVYWDSACTNNVSSINWGSLEPGSNVDRTVYVQNEGNVPMTLSLTEGNWDPTSASTHISLDWDREGSVIDAGSVLQTVLTLSVSSEVDGITSFSFDLTITGTESAS
ncbi:MAG: hypothetical protein JSV85_02345 [Candidatus Bathyarchaeota archaeon]|nr:MAG: hypothetical protein JSV85_02345 [Candidatus Bathyarchaeota archaeon]